MSSRAQERNISGPMSDDTLMARVAARDATAFRQLVEAYAPRVHALAWRMTGDAVTAEDIAQEALLRLWQHADRWQDGGAGVLAWLRRVAANLVLDRARRPRTVSDEGLPDQVDETPLADAAIDQDRLRAAARGAVMALPDRQRAAIILTYFDELSNAEAADMLGMNVKAFESLLLRARAALRDRCVDLRDEHDD